MKNYQSSYLYKLDRFHREQLKSFEADRIKKSLSEEDYFVMKMKKFGINIISKENTRSNDDGIDFLIIENGDIFVCQLKYWTKPLAKKEIKAIFGEMFLSSISLEYKNKNFNIKYLLICPFINNNTFKMIKEYSKEKYYVIHSEEFVELMINPTYFINRKFYESEVYYEEYRN